MSQLKQRLPQVIAAMILVVLLVAGFAATSRLYTSTASDAASAHEEEQNSWETHDPTTSFGYQFDYVGAGSNTSQLMGTMPIGENVRRTQIDGTDVTYTLAPSEDDPVELEENMTYSAIGFLGLVENATSVTFSTAERDFVFTRAAVEEALGHDLGYPMSTTEWESMRADIPQLTKQLVSG